MFFQNIINPVFKFKRSLPHSLLKQKLLIAIILFGNCFRLLLSQTIIEQLNPLGHITHRPLIIEHLYLLRLPQHGIDLLH